MKGKRVLVVVLIALMLLSFNLADVNAASAQQLMPMPGQYYVVQPGDTLYSIAARYHTTVWAIAQANGIANPSRIYIGQPLIIPSVGPMPPVPPMPSPIGGQVIHVVRYGETLSGISRMYGVPVWSIAQVNGLINPNYIFVGQALLIPMAAPMPMPNPVFNPGQCGPGCQPYQTYPVGIPYGGVMPYGGGMMPYGTPVSY